ncbi:MAG: TIM barrel protein [Pseudomonadota bacterium]
METAPVADLALSTAWLRGQDTPEGLLDQVQAAGFSRLELEYRLSAAMVAGLARQMPGRGMAVVSVHNLCPFPPEAAGKLEPSGDLFNLASAEREERDRAVRYTLRSIELAAGLEAAAVVLHLGWAAGLEDKEATRGAARSGGMTPQLRALVAARQAGSPALLDAMSFALEPLIVRAQALGVSLGLENRFHAFQAPNLAELTALFARFNGAPLGYWHDTGHAHNRELAGLNPAGAYLEALGGRLIGCHLHDAKGPDDHQPPYSGDLDWPAVCRALRDARVKTVELKPGPGPAAVATSAARLAAEFAAAGTP